MAIKGCNTASLMMVLRILYLVGKKFNETNEVPRWSFFLLCRHFQVVYQEPNDTYFRRRTVGF